MKYHRLVLSSKKKRGLRPQHCVFDNPKRLWQTVSKLLHRKYSSPLPITSPGTSLADWFAFFHRQNIQTPSLSHQQLTKSSPHSPYPPATPPDFSVFTPASESEIHKILSNIPNKHSDSDHIPTQRSISWLTHGYIFCSLFSVGPWSTWRNTEWPCWWPKGRGIALGRVFWRYEKNEINI